jgi:hypothetical protein
MQVELSFKYKQVRKNWWALCDDKGKPLSQLFFFQKEEEARKFFQKIISSFLNVKLELLKE